MKQNMLPNQQKPGYKVPENYFRDFEADLMARLNEDHILGDTYKGDPGFKTPDAYFDDLENRIFNNIENSGSTKNNGKVIPLIRNKKLYYIAAVAAVFIGIISTLFYQSTNQVYTIDSVELSTLESFIDDGYFELDFMEISTFMIEEGFSFDDYSTTGLSDQAIYNYVDENIEDPNLFDL